MKRYNYNSLSDPERAVLLKRPGGDFSDIVPTVKKVLEDVRRRGDEAVRQYAREFDGVDLLSFGVLPDGRIGGERKDQAGSS
jgi:histidinol dehydrogenase